MSFGGTLTGEAIPDNSKRRMSTAKLLEKNTLNTSLEMVRLSRASSMRSSRSGRQGSRRPSVASSATSSILSSTTPSGDLRSRIRRVAKSSHSDRLESEAASLALEIAVRRGPPPGPRRYSIAVDGGGGTSGDGDSRFGVAGAEGGLAPPPDANDGPWRRRYSSGGLSGGITRSGASQRSRRAGDGSAQSMRTAHGPESTSLQPGLPASADDGRGSMQALTSSDSSLSDEPPMSSVVLPPLSAPADAGAGTEQNVDDEPQTEADLQQMAVAALDYGAGVSSPVRQTGRQARRAVSFQFQQPTARSDGRAPMSDATDAPSDPLRDSPPVTDSTSGRLSPRQQRHVAFEDTRRPTANAAAPSERRPSVVSARSVQPPSSAAPGVQRRFSIDSGLARSRRIRFVVRPAQASDLSESPAAEAAAAAAISTPSSAQTTPSPSDSGPLVRLTGLPSTASFRRSRRTRRTVGKTPATPQQQAEPAAAATTADAGTDPQGPPARPMSQADYVSALL